MKGTRSPRAALRAILTARRGFCVLPGTLQQWWPHLPDNSVHHLITDPPYSVKVHALRRQTPTKGNGGQVGLEQLDFAHLDPATRDYVGFEAWRTVKRWAVVFSDMESHHHWQESLEAWGVEHVRVGLWVKTNPQPQLSGDRPGSGAEALQISHRAGRKRWNGGGYPGTFIYPTANKKEGRICHAQKPFALMADLIRKFTDVGDLVLDPFCGSGTTGAAAVALGRRFIGFEARPALAAAAHRRIRAARRISKGRW